MFERFTDRSRRVVVLAQEEARLLHHNYIGTEHLLLGLVREGEGVAAQVLEALGVRLDLVRSDVQKIIGTGAETVSGHVPFTPRAKKVLELSLREALQLGHNYIGTEHVLLGLVREGQGVAAQVLHNRGATLERIRTEVIQKLSGHGPAWPEPPPGRPATGVFSGSTPAAARAEDEARRLAGDRPVGTHHLLSAILHDEASMAAKALAALGVTPDTVEAQLTSLEVTGTSDELPEEAGARRTSVQLVGNAIAVVFEDEAMVARLAEKLPAEGEARVLRSDHPAGTSFPRLWKAFEHILSDVAWRLDQAAEDAWRPSDWEAGFEVAAYLVMSGPGGLKSHLAVAEGVDVASVRAGLAAWLTANQPTGREMRSYMSVLVDAPDEPGGWGRVRQMTTGEHGNGPKAPVQLLVGHAIIDLTAAA